MEKLDYIFLVSAFLVALFITFISTPLAKNFAYKIGAIDVPKDKRRMHKTPIPRLGGIAIFVGFYISVLVFCTQYMTKEIRGMLLGSIVIVALGIFDDVLALKPSQKFGFQLIATAIPVYCGVRITSLPTIFSASNPYIQLPVVFQYVATIIWLLCILNAVNLIDGLDGLAVGVSGIMSLCAMVILILLASPSVAIITAALAGACLGFLPYNFNPAKMFMGDTGSMFIGYILAVTSVMGLFKAYAIIAFAIPFLIFGLPIFDMIFVAIRRMINGKSPMSADKTHLHHRLIDLGFSQKQAVTIMYGIAALLGLTAVLIAGEGFMRAIVLVVIVFFVVIFCSLVMYKHKIHKEIKDDKTN
jgi:UDP-GlcNAc:undecaprenyl-phosphate GlcNAc-1-phosphate transferase